MISSSYQFSQSGFAAVSFLSVKRGESAHPLASLPFPHIVLGVFASVLFVTLIAVFVLQINVVSGANIRLQKLKKESALLQEEHMSLSLKVRSHVSLDNLERISGTLAMEKAQAYFLEETPAIFVAINSEQ